MEIARRDHQREAEHDDQTIEFLILHAQFSEIGARPLPQAMERERREFASLTAQRRAGIRGVVGGIDGLDDGLYIDHRLWRRRYRRWNSFTAALHDFASRTGAPCIKRRVMNIRPANTTVATNAA